MAIGPYSKPHATSKNWVSHLRAKGLTIAQPNVAAKKIELIGYERLRIYFTSRRDLTIAGKPFLPGTTYKDILQLYEFDMKLRRLCFDHCGIFEVAFRNSMSEALSSAHGGHAHIKLESYESADARRAALAMLSSVYAKSKDARSIHYTKQYSAPILPPIWTLKEFLTFGASIRLYKLLDKSIKDSIAKDFGLPNHIFMEKWASCLVDLRNICAHHDRLFNRSFQKQPQHLKSASVPSPATPVKKLKAITQCLDYMLSKRGFSGGLTASISVEISKVTQVNPAEIGF